MEQLGLLEEAETTADVPGDRYQFCFPHLEEKVGNFLPHRPVTLFHSPLLVAGPRQVLDLLQATLEVKLSCGNEERRGFGPHDVPDRGT